MPTRTPKNQGRRRFDALELAGIRKPPVPFDDERKAVYLRELSETGLKVRSACMAGTSIDAVHNARKKDKEFAALEEAAQQFFIETKLIAEAKRRAIDGWAEPVFQKGHRVHEDCETCKGFGRAVAEHTDEHGQTYYSHTGPVCKACDGSGKGKPAFILRHSDRLLEQLLKAYDNRFREKQETSVTITGGVLAVPMAPLSVEDWSKQYGKPTIDVTDESRSLTPKIEKK